MGATNDVIYHPYLVPVAAILARLVTLLLGRGMGLERMPPLGSFSSMKSSLSAGQYHLHVDTPLASVYSGPNPNLGRTNCSVVGNECDQSDTVPSPDSSFWTPRCHSRMKVAVTGTSPVQAALLARILPVVEANV